MDKVATNAEPPVSPDTRLQVSELRYRRLFETAQDGILLLDGVTGEITDANPFLLDLVGRSLEELRGHKLWDIGPFKDIPQSQAAFGILQQDDYIRYEDLPLLAKSGRRVDVEFVSNAYLVDGRRVIQCNIRDITARKQAETSLRSASRELQRILAKSPTVVYALKVNEREIGPLNYVSENLGPVAGFTVAEACQPHWWKNRIHPDDMARVLAGQDVLFQRGFATQDYRFRLKDERYRWIRDEQRLVRNANDAPVEIVGSWTDVTERLGLEAQLRQAMKMEVVGRLAGGVAHDFNNLLSLIIGYAQSSLQNEALPESVREPLDQILLAALRGAGLTRQLLAFSHKQVLNLQTANLTAVVAGISKMLHRIIGEDIELTVKRSSAHTAVEVDAGQIEQVLMNLAINARDAMPGGGRLSLNTGRIAIGPASIRGQRQGVAGEFVWLRVGDSGCGMSTDTQSRIFEPFFTTKDVGKGTGLGLSTVYGIVRQHRGWIEVASHAGRGSAFTIFLPAAAHAPVVDRPTTTTLATLPPGSETILLVEDDDALRAMCRKILERLGYRIHEADSSRTALAVWAEHRAEIDLLLTDIVMPDGLRGNELARMLQSEAPELRVVFMSGYSSTGSDHADFRKEASFLQKPYTLETLSRIIRDNLDAPRSPATAPTCPTPLHPTAPVAIER